MLIAAQFMTSAFVPFAYAAEATTAAPTPAPYTEDEQKPTDSDNEILKKVSDINGVADLKKNYDNAMNGNASGNGATSDGTDIGDANAAVAQQSQQKREANLKEKKDQQVNGTSSNGYTTYQAVRQDGSFVTVTKNPCYHSTNEQVCQRLNNDMEYYTSDGIAVDAAVLQSIEIQKQQAKMLSSTSTSNPSEYASNLVTATSLSLQNIDLPAAHKLAILAITYQQAMNEAEIANEEKLAAQKAKEKENAKLQERIQERKDSILRKEQIQKEMNILSVEDNNGKTDFNKTSFFTVSIDPGFPTTIDGKNVELTLKPKDKEKAKNGTMTASFKNLKEGRTQTIPVTEQFQNGDPIIVEMGNWDDRPEGQRTVTFTYTPNDGGKKEIYIVRYTVSAYLNTLNSEGQTTRNSVVSAILNAPLSMETDASLSLAKYLPRHGTWKGVSAASSLMTRRASRRMRKLSSRHLTLRRIPARTLRENTRRSIPSSCRKLMTTATCSAMSAAAMQATSASTSNSTTRTSQLMPVRRRKTRQDTRMQTGIFIQDAIPARLSA